VFAAAGPAEMTAACRAHAPCPTGSAVATPGFGLERRGVEHVIHAVGPVWPRHDDPHEQARAASLLAGAYRSVLAIADQLGVRCLAVPALSTGVYGYPPERAAEVATGVLAEHAGPLEVVLLVAFDEAAAAPLRAALARRSGSDPVEPIP